MNLKKVIIGFLLFCSATALFSQTMYVTATNGLRQRLTPSTDGKVVGTFLYCEPIQVREKSKNTVTIDGITGYWYKVDCDIIFEGKYVRYSYVFGGYVSDKLPADAPVTKFEGYWEGDSNNEGVSYIFSVKNIDSAFLFYKDILKLKHVMKSSRSAYFLAGKVWLALDQQEKYIASENYSHICFNIPKRQYKYFITKIKEKMITEWQKNQTEGDSIYILDDSGNKLEIHFSTLKERIKYGKKHFGNDVEWYI